MGSTTIPRTAGDERGIALIVVLIMLLLLSIMGMSVLSSTVSDLRITADSRRSMDALFSADAALEYAESSTDIYSSIGTLPSLQNTWPGITSGQKYPGYAPVSVGNLTAYAKVDFTSTGPVPAEMGTESDSGLGPGSGFKANYYTVSVIGESASGESRAELETQVIKVVPK